MVTPAPPPVLPGAAVVGGGPAGLMAAERLLAAGVPVDLFESRPSVGRKFLLAGKGGLNLTHAEPFEPFAGRYRERAGLLRPLLSDFGADALRAWAAELGIETFVGTSQRVFPRDLKAAPLLRAWLHRLRTQGLRVHVRHRWAGWQPGTGALRFATPGGERHCEARATVLALGGGSWPQLGSDGAWVPVLGDAGVDVAPLLPANCGFDTATPPSEHLRSRHAGAPLKTIALQWTGVDGRPQRRPGECVLTTTGLEGGVVYAASADLRQAIAAQGRVTVHLDLLPAHRLEDVVRAIAHPRGARSMASHLQSRLKLAGVKAAVLREWAAPDDWHSPERLAHAIKALPIVLRQPRPLAEAISTAGGVRFEGLTPELMLQRHPGTFVAGEMLDWEAPTGGYLLTACWATGAAAGDAAARWCRAGAPVGQPQPKVPGDSR
jgi:hypothetical protein